MLGMRAALEIVRYHRLAGALAAMLGGVLLATTAQAEEAFETLRDIAVDADEALLSAAGLLTWPDGRRYEGELAAGQPHGDGTPRSHRWDPSARALSPRQIVWGGADTFP